MCYYCDNVDQMDWMSGNNSIFSLSRRVVIGLCPALTTVPAWEVCQPFLYCSEDAAGIFPRAYAISILQTDSNMIFLMVCWREVLDGKVWQKLGPLHDWAVLLKETYNLQKPTLPAKQATKLLEQLSWVIWKQQSSPPVRSPVSWWQGRVKPV